MTPPKYTGELIERYAIWDAHNGLCSYCGRWIEFNYCQIDHIIPRRLSQYKYRTELSDIFNQISTMFQLPKDFDIDTFHNVILSCCKCNNEKGSKLLDKISLVYRLNQAGYKYEKVVNKYNEINCGRSKLQAATSLYSSLKEGKITIDDIDDIKLIALDNFKHHVLVEMDVWKETSSTTLGISGDVDDIYGFEIAFDWYKENKKIKAPNKDRNATLYLMSTMNQKMYNKQYLYTGIIDRSNGNLLLLPGKPPEIQLLLPPGI
jgi:5-methylcytosine-specific restriction endonuclease McrA